MSRRLLSPVELADQLSVLPGWSVAEGGTAICRAFRFDRYMDGIAFVNRLAALAESRDHHPDLSVGWCRVTVQWSTHDIGGVSGWDVECAAQTDRPTDRLTDQLVDQLGDG